VLLYIPTYHSKTNENEAHGYWPFLEDYVYCLRSRLKVASEVYNESVRFSRCKLRTLSTFSMCTRKARRHPGFSIGQPVLRSGYIYSLFQILFFLTSHVSHLRSFRRPNNFLAWPSVSTNWAFLLHGCRDACRRVAEIKSHFLHRYLAPLNSPLMF
jgi:hypothetical protein